MQAYATKDDVQEIVSKSVDGAVDDLSQIIQTFAQNVDERFIKVETNIADLKTDIAGLSTKYDRLITTLDAFLKRLDDAEVNNMARDAQLARLERWIEQVAEKTGVKLEY